MSRPPSFILKSGGTRTPADSHWWFEFFEVWRDLDSPVVLVPPGEGVPAWLSIQSQPLSQ